MNDEQHTNDPIERLFREKAEEYNISYREEDWLKLEKQLDARDMQLSYRRRVRWFAAASLLILSLIGYYTFQNYTKINQLADQLNQNEAIQENAQPQDEQTLTNEPQENSDQTTDTEREGSESEEFSEEHLGEKPIEQSVSQHDSADTPPANEGERQLPNLENEEFAGASQVIQRKSLNPVFFNSELTANLILERDWIPPLWLAGRHPVDEKDNQTVNPDANTLALMEDKYGHSTNIAQAPKFAIGVVVSPDLSTVGSLSNFYDPGFKGGLMAEYSLTRNFSVMGGVAFSNVKYKAAGQAYDPPPYWNSGVLPDETSAVCLILDIPISVKAVLKNFERSRIFTTAGISSYIMLNEDYRFSYEGYSEGLQKSWNGRTGTRHWLSNASISVGIEWDLSPNWSLRAEPHLKIPMKGVGWGNVELYSLGSFLSINYRFTGN